VLCVVLKKVVIEKMWRYKVFRRKSLQTLRRVHGHPKLHDRGSGISTYWSVGNPNSIKLQIELQDRLTRVPKHTINHKSFISSDGTPEQGASHTPFEDSESTLSQVSSRNEYIQLVGHDVEVFGDRQLDSNFMTSELVSLFTMSDNIPTA
jgi:hypothetical protein